MTCQRMVSVFCIYIFSADQQRVGNRYSNITSEIQFVKRFWARRGLYVQGRDLNDRMRDLMGYAVPAMSIPAK